MYSSFKPKPRRPGSKQALWDLLDDLVSRIVRLRLPYCVTCGVNFDLTCSHIFSRGHGPTRFDIDPGGNNVAQCAKCNGNHNINKVPLYDWYVLQNGERALDDLSRRAVSEKHWNHDELIDLVVEYKAILKREQGLAA